MDTVSLDSAAPLYRPPAPKPLTPTGSLARALMTGERDLLSLLPDDAYRMWFGKLGRSRRGIYLVNDPDLVRRLMADDVAQYPKNDLFVGALEPLIGQGVFISGGETWRRQRAMIEPAFGHIRIGQAFAHMRAALDLYLSELDSRARRGQSISIMEDMSRLTADVMCRTIFSRPLEEAAAQKIFEDFAQFQNTVANVKIGRLLLGRPLEAVRQPAAVRAACGRIRAHLKQFIADRRHARGESIPDDIATDIMAATDPETGAPFSDDELVDQIGVFFLAGHETSAGTVGWMLFLLSQQPNWVTRIRDEIAAVAGGAPLDFEATKQLHAIRNVMRETLRLYPPGPFLPRVALQDTLLNGQPIPRGAMLMISPWIVHRHTGLWRAPDRFDPDRFAHGQEPPRPGSYLPFGFGPRVCVGAAFATVECTLIVGELLRRFDLVAERPRDIRPVARLTIGPAQPMLMRLIPRRRPNPQSRSRAR